MNQPTVFDYLTTPALRTDAMARVFQHQYGPKLQAWVNLPHSIVTLKNACRDDRVSDSDVERLALRTLRDSHIPPTTGYVVRVEGKGTGRTVRIITSAVDMAGP